MQNETVPMTDSSQSPRAKAARKAQATVRGVFEKIPRSGQWFIRYVDADGRYRRERVHGSKGNAIHLLAKRRIDAFEGKSLPDKKLRRAPKLFSEIARDLLAYSKANKLSYKSDVYRMETLLAWFRDFPVAAVTATEIEKRFNEKTWSPATANRHRALLSLTYRLAIRNGKAKENPARLVAHRLEDNARIRYLLPEEEIKLRKAIQDAEPERLPELTLSLNTGMRAGEQYRLRWADVSFPQRSLMIPRSKNGSLRHIPLNAAAFQALEALQSQGNGSEFVCGGAREPRRWFEPAVTKAGLTDYSWHCNRHTFASRLVMAGVDIRTAQELLGHKTIAMTVRYSHLAPQHTLAAVERLDVGPVAEASSVANSTSIAPNATAATQS